jgi:hypothetical protein
MKLLIIMQKHCAVYQFWSQTKDIHGGGIDVFFNSTSYTKVDPGLIKHSPFSRQTPSSPKAILGGIMACTFSPTLILATTSFNPGITAVDPSLNKSAFFLPSE